MSPPKWCCALLLLLACAAGSRAQITDVVVLEPLDKTDEGAPAPALVATIDAQGIVDERVISPQDVEAVRPLAHCSSAHRSEADVVTGAR